MAGDAWHETHDSGDWADELVVTPDGSYLRSAESVAELADEPWELMPAGAFDAALPEGDDLRAQFLFLLGLDFDGDGEVDGNVADDGGTLVGDEDVLITEEGFEPMVVPALASYYLFGLGGPAATTPMGGPVPTAGGPGRHVRLVRGRRGRLRRRP